MQFVFVMLTDKERKMLIMALRTEMVAYIRSGLVFKDQSSSHRSKE